MAKCQKCRQRQDREFYKRKQLCGLGMHSLFPLYPGFLAAKRILLSFQGRILPAQSVLRQLAAEHQGNRIVFYMTMEMSQSAPV